MSRRFQKKGDPEVPGLGVAVRPGEPIDKAIRRFTRAVRNDGILQEIYLRRSYQKPSVRVRQKAHRAEVVRRREERKSKISRERS